MTSYHMTLYHITLYHMTSYQMTSYHMFRRTFPKNNIWKQKWNTIGGKDFQSLTSEKSTTCVIGLSIITAWIRCHWSKLFQKLLKNSTFTLELISQMD